MAGVMPVWGCRRVKRACVGGGIGRVRGAASARPLASERAGNDGDLDRLEVIGAPSSGLEVDDVELGRRELLVVCQRRGRLAASSVMMSA